MFGFNELIVFPKKDGNRYPTNSKIIRRLYLRYTLIYPCLILFSMLYPSIAFTKTSVSYKPLKVWKLIFVRSGNIWICDGNGTRQRRIINNGSHPCWLKGENSIAFVRRGNIWVADSQGGKQHQLTFFNDKHASSLYPTHLSWDIVDHWITFSRNEKFMVRRIGSSKYEELTHCSSIYTVSLSKSLAVIYNLSEDGSDSAFSRNECPSWSRTGKYLLFSRNGDIWVAVRGDRRDSGKGWNQWQWDVSRLDAIAEFDDPNWRGSRANWYPARFSWSPEGNRFAYVFDRDWVSGTAAPEIHLVSLTGEGEELSVLKDKTIAQAQGHDVSFSPDGKYLAFTKVANASGIHLTLNICLISIYQKRTYVLVKNAEQPEWEY